MELDTSPLTVRPGPAGLRSFGRPDPGGAAGRGPGRSLLSAVVAAVAVVAPPAWLVATILADGDATLPLVTTLLVSPWGLLTIVRQLAADRRASVLTRFARANGLRYQARRTGPPLPGTLFAAYPDAPVTDVVSGERERPIEVGNVVVVDRAEDEYRCGYVAVRLGGAGPHLVLASRAATSLFRTALTGTVDDGQRRTLGGEAGRSFTLYAPAGLDVADGGLPPEVLASLVEHGEGFDVEIVGGWLFLYAARPLSVPDAPTWQRVARLVAGLVPALPGLGSLPVPDGGARLAREPESRWGWVLRFGLVAAAIAVVVLVTGLLTPGGAF